MIDVAKESTAQEILASIGGGSGIKSIQRGFVVTSDYTTSVRINDVDPNKCFVLLDGCYGFWRGQSGSASSEQAAFAVLPIVESLSKDTLVIARSLFTTSSGTTGWQVIEFM